MNLTQYILLNIIVYVAIAISLLILTFVGFYNCIKEETLTRHPCGMVKK